MDAHSLRTTKYPLWLGVALVALFASILTADAKCTIRSGDPLIKARYQGCNPRAFISYLYNDLITPYSFTCAKQLKATCQNERCEHPSTEAEARRCLDRFADVLTSCNQQIDDAARMAKCTDTKAWPVERILAQFVASMPKTTVAMTTTATTRAVPVRTKSADVPMSGSMSVSSLPRSNGPMTSAEKAELAAATAADSEATAKRTAPPAATTVSAEPNAVLDTTSPPATPTLVGPTPERAPAATTEIEGPADVASPTNLAPAPPAGSPSVRVEPLPGEAYEIARKPARTTRAPRKPRL